jgi:hypothetical protein
MVQVDVFWSYVLGSTFAVSASSQLARQRAAKLSRFADPYFTKTLLFLALIFVPSGAYLVWNFPSWETMHVGDRNMPAWLISAFAITNVTQGLLAYVVVDRLLARGRSYLAYLQIVAGYFAMFFILVHGWDGTGYRRFFSPTKHDFLAWHGDWAAWLTSDVALTLYAMGAVLVPVLLLMVARWHARGATAAALMLVTVFGAGLGLAVLAHLCLAWLGTAAGVPIAVAVVAALLMPGGPVHRLQRALDTPAEGRASTTAVAAGQPA